MTAALKQAAPRERPILFSGEMVRAILEGRKTQTRRAIKPVQPRADGLWPAGRNPLEDSHYGQPGDRLWVRETWCLASPHTWDAPKRVNPDTKTGEAAYFKADWERSPPSRWRPSIHMPRWACRLELELTSVRVERLQDISEADAKAEGADPWKLEMDVMENTPGTHAYRTAFRALWTSINGAESWDATPWVWCLGFRRVG